MKKNKTFVVGILNKTLQLITHVWLYKELGTYRMWKQITLQ